MGVARRPGRISRTTRLSGTVRRSRSTRAVPRNPVAPVTKNGWPASASRTRVTRSVYHMVSDRVEHRPQASPGRGRSRPPGPAAGTGTSTSAAGPTTSERILDAALASFATRGYEASSLDALADGLEIRKQTILYWFPSKEVLLEAVIDRSAVELSSRAGGVVGHGRWGMGAGRGGGAVGVPAGRPAAASCSAWCARWAGSGTPAATRMVSALDPLVTRASEFLEAEMDAGHMRRHEPRLLLLAIYSTVIGMVTEVEVRQGLRRGAHRPFPGPAPERDPRAAPLGTGDRARLGPDQSGAWAALRSRREGFGAGGGGRFGV